MSRKVASVCVGDVVAITFCDHCQGGRELLRFTVYGRVAHIENSFISVNCWEYAADPDADDDNVDCYTIARAAIETVQRLAPQ